jgi:putative transposase
MKKLLNKNPTKAIKIRIYPNKEQTVLLYKTFGCCRKLYNAFLELKQKRLPCPTEKEFKEQFPYMFEVDSVAIQQSRINLDNAFSNFFKSITGRRKGRKINAPKFKSKKNDVQSYRTTNSMGAIHIDFETRHIRLPKLGWIKFRDPRVFSSGIRSATVSRDASHRFYVLIISSILILF